jgi:dienelactone hydrolase
MATHNKAKIGVIVVHEWWGLNDYAHSRVKQLTDLGYAAIAADMYGEGKTAQTANDAQALMMAAFAEPEKMHARFQQAKTQLEKTSGLSSDHIYAIGYSFTAC